MITARVTSPGVEREAVEGDLAARYVRWCVAAGMRVLRAAAELDHVMFSLLSSTRSLIAPTHLPASLDQQASAPPLSACLAIVSLPPCAFLV
jgi:hypothetical protein